MIHSAKTDLSQRLKEAQQGQAVAAFHGELHSSFLSRLCDSLYRGGLWLFKGGARSLQTTLKIGFELPVSSGFITIRLTADL